MKGKMAVLIALAIALLSVSAVCAYASYVLAQQEKRYIPYEAVTINGNTYSFTGWVTVEKDGSYRVPLFDSSGRYSGMCIYHRNGSDIGELIHVDYESPPSPEMFAAASATTGLAGAFWLAIVCIKKKKGCW
jgi:hypothetical protein